MKSFVAAILLLAASVSAQSARGDTIATSRAAAPAAPAPAAAPAAPAAPAPAAPAAPAARTAPAGPVDPFANCQQCFGPGVGNPLAIKPLPFVLQNAMKVARQLPNIRLFFDVDGSFTPTDEFGREIEVLDAFGRDAFDFEEQLEIQQEQAQQQQQLQLQRQRLEAQLSNIMRQLGNNRAAPAAPQAAQAPAPAAAPPSRFFIQN